MISSRDVSVMNKYGVYLSLIFMMILASFGPISASKTVENGLKTKITVARISDVVSYKSGILREKTIHQAEKKHILKKCGNTRIDSTPPNVEIVNLENDSYVSVTF